MSKVESIRNSIRAATLGFTVPFKSEIINFNGVDVEIRQPSHKSRTELYKKATDESGKVDMLSFLTYAVILNTYVPGTQETVFEESDFEVMVAKPVGGFLDKFGETASKLLNVEADLDNKSKGAD